MSLTQNTKIPKNNISLFIPSASNTQIYHTSPFNDRNLMQNSNKNFQPSSNITSNFNHLLNSNTSDSNSHWNCEKCHNLNINTKNKCEKCHFIHNPLLFSPASPNPSSKPIDKKEIESFHSEVIKNYKTYPCIFKSCNKSNCRSFHHPKERRRSLKEHNYSIHPCKNIKDANTDFWKCPSKCPLHDNCPNAHTITEISYHPEYYKTFLCESYTESRPSDCLRGIFCHLAHGYTDLRRINEHQTQVQVNTQIQSKNTKFTHDLDRKFDKLSIKNDGLSWPMPESPEMSRSHDKSSDNTSFSNVKLDLYPQYNKLPSTMTIPAPNDDESEKIKSMRHILVELEIEANNHKKVLEENQKNLVEMVIKRLHEADKQSKIKREMELRKLKESLEMEQKRFEALETRLECSICYSNHVDTVLIPCGHVFCQLCINNSDRKSCMLCGQNWTHLQQINL